MTLLELRALALAPGVPAPALALAFDMRKHGRNWDDIVKAVHVGHPGVRRPDLVSALVAVYPETNRPAPAKLRAKLDAAARRYARFAAAGNDWGSGGSAVDCRSASLAVGATMEAMGHRVRVVLGDAVDARFPGEEPDIHVWLEIDGYFHDPKERILRDDDPTFAYARRIKTYTGLLSEWDWEDRYDDDDNDVLPLLIATYAGKP